MISYTVLPPLKKILAGELNFASQTLRSYGLPGHTLSTHFLFEVLGGDGRNCAAAWILHRHLELGHEDVVQDHAAKD